MAAEGSDNPILDMGLLGMMQPNPYLDPTLNYNADGTPKPLALPGFRGAATDAYGRAIGAPPPGTTTLNTPGPGATAAPAGGQPASGTFNYGAMGSAGAPLQELMSNYQAAQSKLSPQQQYDQAQTRQMDTRNAQNIANLNMNRTAGGGMGAGNNVMNSGPDYSSPVFSGSGAAGPAAAAPAPTGTDPRQAYLDALANPGPLTPVGAAVPASKPLGTPSVLNAFMAAHPSGGTKGAGGYDNSGFFSTLSNLKSA